MPIFVWVLINGDVVVVIKMSAYIHGCLFCVGAYYPDFMVSGVHDPLKDHLIEMMFNKPYTVCNLHKCFGCMYVVDNISYIIS